MYRYGSFHQVGARFDGVSCYIRKCTIYYPWLWLLTNIVVISYWRWRDWFHSNVKNSCARALIIKNNRWYIYGCNNWHRHKSCPNLVEWPIYTAHNVYWFKESKCILIELRSWTYKQAFLHVGVQCTCLLTIPFTCNTKIFCAQVGQI